MPTYRAPVAAFIALGANLGNARSTVLKAIEDIGRLSGTRVVRRSSLYRTKPIDSSGPDYVNAVVELATALDAFQLLGSLQKMEQLAGRERPYVNAPRTLDLDILLYGDAQMQGPRLTVPHPRMRQRAFVLRPLAEICPTLVPPDWLQAVFDQTAHIDPC